MKSDKSDCQRPSDKPDSAQSQDSQQGTSRSSRRDTILDDLIRTQPIDAVSHAQKTFVRLGTKLLDRYCILDDLGRGGMGRVFKADDLILKKPVALKFLRGRYAADVEMVRRFRREVRTAQEVSHRHVCRVHDIGEIEGRPFLSMEFVAGPSLAQHLESNGPTPLNEAVEIALQLCSGLEAIHKEEIIHRDLKPGNIMLTKKGDIKITDFGLAGALADFANEKALSGTPLYMAPEQLTGRSVSIGSDLFSLGVVLYELFTGRRAFTASSTSELQAIHQRGPTAPINVRPDLKHTIQDIILQCLQLDPKARPSSARTVYIAIADFLDELDLMALEIVGTGASKRKMLSVLETGSDVEPPSEPPTWVAGAENNSPFVSRRVVRGDEFINRENELRRIMGHIYKSESVLIIGEVKSGKSSLLRKVREKTYQEYLDPEAADIAGQWIDFGSVPATYTPADFWIESLSFLARISEPQITQALNRVKNSGYRKEPLLELFEIMERSSLRLVLLLDEFDHLVAHRNFKAQKHFFALLRSICTNIGSLCVVASSRQSVASLHERCPPEAGSPYFYHLAPVLLEPFDDGTIDILLAKGSIFSTEDRGRIRRVAGKQPYLLQGLADTLYLTDGRKQWQDAMSYFLYHQAADYFDELWRWDRLNDSCLAVMVILGLAEWSGRAVLKSEFDYKDIGKMDDFSFELKLLERVGIAEKLQGDRPRERPCMIWRGQLWQLSSEVLTWLIWDLVIGETSNTASYSEWLKAEGYSSVLTSEEWSRLLDTVLKKPFFMDENSPGSTNPGDRPLSY